MKYLLTFLMLSLIAGNVSARPVSYPGGWTLITENDADENSALMHYTVTPKLAVGYRIAYDRNAEETFHMLQMNNLLKRWNKRDSQANIYLKSGIGVGAEQGNADGFVGGQADWEDRRFMVMYETMAMMSPDENRRRFHQSFAFGIAPYVAEFGSLHTWIMPHVMHQTEDKKSWQFAPMVRMFKGDILVEAGYNVTMERPIVNATIRF